MAPMNYRGKSGTKGRKGKMMYTQEDMDGAKANHSVPGSRKKLASHYGGTQKEFNAHMAGYKPTGVVSTGGSRTAGKPRGVGSTRKPKGMKY